MLKVLIVTAQSGGGGAERAMSLLASTMLNNQVNVVFFPLKQSKHDLLCETQNVVAPIIYEDSNYLSIIKKIKVFIQTVSMINPEIVILNCDLPEFMGLFLKSSFKRIIVEHARHPWGKRRLLGITVRLIHIVKKTKFVAVSHHLRIWPLSGRPHQVIPNIVSLDILAGKKIKIEKIKRLVFIGRLSKLKRPDWFLEIVELSKIQGVIFGDGEMKDYLIGYINSRKLPIKMYGYRNKPFNNIKRGDLLIVPSISEGDGLVILESLLNGIPLLLSDIKDFQRFHFPKFMYCANPSDFNLQIKKINLGKKDFIISASKINNLFNKRNPYYIANKWNKLFINL